MGSNEVDKSAKEKELKEPSSAASTAMTTPDWSGFQAYSPIPPHGFVASSPQAHPYMWGVQHMMPPYGTSPHPYVAMYPPSGIYAHPSLPPASYPFSPYAMPSPNGIAEATGNTSGGIEDDAKQSEAKEKLPIKRSRGSLGSLNMIIGKNNEHGKISGASSNGVYSKSAESVTDGTSEGSDSNSQNDSGSKQDSKEAEAASQNGGSGHDPQAVPIIPHSAGVPCPTTNLNIGMDYWGGPSSPAIPGMSGKVSSGPIAGVVAPPGSRDGAHSQPWLRDERELKQQRRKQSNRESARRSRLRKQAECDELTQKAEALIEENTNLRTEVDKLKNLCEELMAENRSLKDQLMEFPSLEDINSDKNDPEEPDVQTDFSNRNQHDLDLDKDQ